MKRLFDFKNTKNNNRAEGDGLRLIATIFSKALNFGKALMIPKT
jgi:hypothetical protein